MRRRSRRGHLTATWMSRPTRARSTKSTDAAWPHRGRALMVARVGTARCRPRARCRLPRQIVQADRFPRSRAAAAPRWSRRSRCVLPASCRSSLLPRAARCLRVPGLQFLTPPLCPCAGQRASRFPRSLCYPGFPVTLILADRTRLTSRPPCFSFSDTAA